jgi:hypothetical protein
LKKERRRKEEEKTTRIPVGLSSIDGYANQPEGTWRGQYFVRVGTNAGLCRFNDRSLCTLSSAVTVCIMGVNGILRNGLDLCC